AACSARPAPADRAPSPSDAPALGSLVPSARALAPGDRGRQQSIGPAVPCRDQPRPHVLGLGGPPVHQPSRAHALRVAKSPAGLPRPVAPQVPRLPNQLAQLPNSDMEDRVLECPQHLPGSPYATKRVP